VSRYTLYLRCRVHKPCDIEITLFYFKVLLCEYMYIVVLYRPIDTKRKFNILGIGQEKVSEYTFLQSTTTDECAAVDHNSIASDWSEILTSEMTSYEACSFGMTCSIGEMSIWCEENTINVQYSITVGCEIVYPTGIIVRLLFSKVKA